jgi:MOSC domain-containing protein
MIIGKISQVWRYPVKSMAGEGLDKCQVETNGLPGDRGWALRDERSREISGAKRFPALLDCVARYRSEPVPMSDDGNNPAVPHVDLTLPDGLVIGSDDPSLNSRLSHWLGRPVSLWPLQPASDQDHYRRNGISATIIGRLSRLGVVRNQLPRILNLGPVKKDISQFFAREPGEAVPDLTVLPRDLLEFTSSPGTYFDAFPIHLLTTASLAAMARVNPGAAWDVRRFRPNFVVEITDETEGLVEAQWSGRTLRIGTLELKCEVPTARCGMTTHPQQDLPRDPSVLRSIVKDADQNLGIYASVHAPGSVAIDDFVELL